MKKIIPFAILSLVSFVSFADIPVFNDADVLPGQYNVEMTVTSKDNIVEHAYSIGVEVGKLSTVSTGSLVKSVFTPDVSWLGSLFNIKPSVRHFGEGVDVGLSIHMLLKETEVGILLDLDYAHTYVEKGTPYAIDGGTVSPVFAADKRYENEVAFGFSKTKTCQQFVLDHDKETNIEVCLSKPLGILVG
jgi:hypothetical protein